MIGRAFRPDIEGLRAVAVLGVLLFHVAPSDLRGGFVGVDVFFVISGYLIAGAILAEARGGSFSYLDFYARRLRRLAPAYLAMMAAVFAAAQVVLLPKEMTFLGEAALASVAYVSNMLFMLEAGYFSDHLKGSPLLHTWSLSVEEQFYLVFPAALLASLALPRRAMLALWAVIAAASLVAAELLIETQEAWAFFLAPTRFWQFLAGAALAAVPPRRLRPFAADTLAFGGLALIAGSYLLYTPEIRFPGLAAIPPTLGAAAVIAAGGAGRLSGFALGNPVAGFFGRIS
jgi:peptidoglycan/LPS O-acetylase OafA/YrhL